MDQGLPTCPSCGASVSPHDVRCPDCKQVLGADNVCERCHALAPAVHSGAGIVCTACGGQRTQAPRTVVVTDRQLRWMVGWERLQLKLYLTGALGLLFLGLLFTAIAWLLFGDTAHPWVAMIPVLITVFSVGGLSLHTRKVRRRSQRRERFTIEQRLLGFAHQQGGVVSAEQVSKSLGISLASSNALLEERVRAGQAEMDLTERGEIRFAFHARALPGAPAAKSSAAGARPMRGGQYEST